MTDPTDAPPAEPPDFPADLRYLVEHQTWARFGDDGLVTVGITALGILQSGEIYMCRPKPVGTVVERGRALAVVELAKAIASVRSPVSGTVVETNPRLAATPELVHRSPYGEGWIARLRIEGAEAQQAALASPEAAMQAMHAEASAGPLP